mgnify:CR=1 FL=1
MASTASSRRAVFRSTARTSIHEYSYRRVIERGYESIKRSMAATTSKDFGLRSVRFRVRVLLFSSWRAVDLLGQVELTGEYERSPLVTAENTLALLKRTRVG